ERANASGSTSTIATASMKPAPNATTCAITASSRAARRATARPPTTLPRAATRAYRSALDTRQEILAGVAPRVLEDLGEQALERLAHRGPGPHPRLEQVGARHREVFEGQRVLGGADRGDDIREPGEGKGEARVVERRQQREQIVRRVARGREPAPHRREIAGIGIALAPLPDRPPALDLAGGALEPGEQRRGIAREERRHEHRIARQRVHPFPLAPRAVPD